MIRYKSKNGVVLDRPPKRNGLSITAKRALLLGGISALFIGGFYYYKTQQNKSKSSSQSCCGGASKKESKEAEVTDYKSIVKSRYSATARNFESNTKEEKEKLQSLAKAFGYSASELLEIGSANLGLSCGNPVSQANLQKGEVVLDLGCGAGMDLFLAKKYIGDSKDGGQLLGVDFSKDMLAKAKENAQRKKKEKNMDISNFKFLYSEIEDMREVIEDNSVDCVISNCVMNLIPNKLNAFKEVYRVLKPNGGRICLSDIALKKKLPDVLKNDISGYVNCVSGTIPKEEYEALLFEAGFKHVKMINKSADLNVWKDSWDTMVGGGCCEPEKKEKPKSSGCCGGDNNEKANEDKGVNELLQETNLNDYIASYYVFAMK